MTARRLMLSVFTTTLGALAFAAAPALAATPEPPKTEPATAITATTATAHGVLDPKKASAEVVVEYDFFYAPRGAGCAEAFLAPESPGMATGKLGEKVEVALTGLEPSTEYALCLAARNPGEEAWTDGNAVPFATKAAPPTVVSEPATSVKATEARLEGLVNPNNQVTECHFQYATTEPSLAASTPVACEAATLEGFGEQPVGLPVAGLAQNTTYYYRVLAKNAKGEETTGTPVEHFTTPITPETPEKLEAKPIAANTATLNGILNPGAKGNAGTYEFRYRKSLTECQGGEPGEEIATAATKQLGEKGEAAKAEIAGLLPHTTYTFCLQGANEAGEATLSAPTTFTTLAAPPTVEDQFTTEVASTSVTLNAKVNPQGAATTYTFELASAGGAFAPVTEPEGTGTLAEGTAGVPVSVHVQHGLAPDTSYEFRLATSNSVQPVTGEPEPVAFTTQRPGGTVVLPDNRQWEMVTPPDKRGALFYGYQNAYYAQQQASVHGNAFVEEASQPTEAEPQGYDNKLQVLSTRGPEGWSSQSLGVPRTESAGPSIANRKEYHFFSEDLSLGVVSQFGDFTALSPEASDATIYIHTDYLNGNVADHCESSYLSASSCYRPLVSGCPAEPAECKPSVKEYADVPPGTDFGETRDGHCIKAECGQQFVDGTPDLSHVILESGAQLTSTPDPSHDYEWSAGRLQPLPGTLAGNPRKIQHKGLEELNVHTISVNGQRLILENGEGPGKQLLLRVNSMMPQSPLAPGGECEDPTDACSIQINATQGGTGNSGGGLFQIASSDDSRVFFLDESRLTSDSTAGSGEPDLYEYDLAKPAGERLSDLSVGQGGPANVTSVLGASEDGSHVYFTAAGAIAGTNAAPSTCDMNIASDHEGQAEEEAATCNVYVRHAGVTSLVAAAGPLIQSAEVSPDGRYLEFMSDKDLTGYDTRDAVSDKLDLETYLYHAPENLAAEPGRLVCASCNPTGARPIGTENYNASLEVQGEGIEAAEEGTAPGQNGSWMAAGVPTWHYLNAQEPELQRQARYLSDSGRLFFDSGEALVPQDINGKWDVYEYEPQGVGSCTSASARFGARSGGCVSLISSGTSSADSALLDTSETGGDVFFVTTSKLASQDYDTAYDVYDAHVCSSEAPCIAPPAVPPPPCDTEASCKAAPTPQPEIYGAPSSATFSGLGNVIPPPSPPAKKVTKKTTVKCKKGLARNKKGKCLRKKSKHKKATKSAHTNRRAQ